jgi:hypothetical protein
MTLAVFCKCNDIDISVSEAALHSVNLMELCDILGDEVVRTENSKGVMVKSYPEYALKEYFEV